MGEKVGKTAIAGRHIEKLLPVVARQESSAYSAVLGDPIPIGWNNIKREWSNGKAGYFSSNKQVLPVNQTPLIWLSVAASMWPSHTAMKQSTSDRPALAPARSHSPSRARLSVCKLNEEKVV